MHKIVCPGISFLPTDETHIRSANQRIMGMWNKEKCKWKWWMAEGREGGRVMPLCSPWPWHLLLPDCDWPPWGWWTVPVRLRVCWVACEGALVLCPKCSSLRLPFLNLLSVTADTVGRGWRCCNTKPLVSVLLQTDWSWSTPFTSHGLSFLPCKTWGLAWIPFVSDLHYLFPLWDTYGSHCSLTLSGGRYDFCISSVISNLL